MGTFFEAQALISHHFILFLDNISHPYDLGNEMAREVPMIDNPIEAVEETRLGDANTLPVAPAKIQMDNAEMLESKKMQILGAEFQVGMFCRTWLNIKEPISITLTKPMLTQKKGKRKLFLKLQVSMIMVC